MKGNIHNGFPPGQMIWTSLEGRQEYEKLVRTAIRPPEWYHHVAARLEEKMRARCGGRSWVGAHMRRGDFLAYEWAANVSSAETQSSLSSPPLTILQLVNLVDYCLFIIISFLFHRISLTNGKKSNQTLTLGRISYKVALIYCDLPTRNLGLV